MQQLPSYFSQIISDLNVRIYSKMIANRLKSYLPDIIHLDQRGFTMGREAGDNVLKMISLIEAAQQLNMTACLIAVDTMKAFDRVDWLFLEESLHKIGPTTNLFHKIRTVYNKPTTRFRAIRQGCPLSPSFMFSSRSTQWQLAVITQT